jgi:hypothetical protein
MSKLMEQVQEIREQVEAMPAFSDGMDIVDRVPALCHAIEVLAAAVEARTAWVMHQDVCMVCRDSEGYCAIGAPVWRQYFDATVAARELIRTGLQPPSICNSAT